MRLIDHQTLIQNLPVRQQCFTTHRINWKKYEQNFPLFAQINNELFNELASLTLNRDDVINTKNIKHQILKTIYWGYPRGMRGNNFGNILSNLDEIKNIFQDLREQEKLNDKSYFELKDKVARISGLGLSTYSKILYFLGLSFNANPCLILDQRLINVFNSNVFEEFNDFPNLGIYNAQNHYLTFLQTFKKLAEELGTKGENIEQFLFIFGNNLK